jgi:CHAT domain-containing protein
MLLAPLAGQLGHKRLAVVTEGALQYIPFAALKGPDNVPLALDHEIVSLPSASTLGILRQQSASRTPAPRNVAVFGDPVFDRSDSRVTAGNSATAAETASESLTRSAQDAGLGRFERLRATRAEAEAIAGFAGAKSSKFLDFDATREAAMSADLSQYRMVHFAVHGLLNNVHPELSGLVFSLVDREGRARNGFLQAFEAYNLRLSADLVVLSACQTAVGDDVKGEGLLGLSRGFMYAGSPRVVASLWKVPDRATSDLMKHFYRAMLVDKLRPAAALRVAQLAIRKDPRTANPYFWAGFILQGEWK